MQDWIEIEIINWEKYNPRSDRKNHTWFRLDNAIATEPKFFGLSAAQKFVAICLFGEVSKSGGGMAKVSVPWLSDVLKVKPSEIWATIHSLVSSGVFRLPLATNSPDNIFIDNPNFQSSLTTDGRTDVRTDTPLDPPSQEAGPKSYQGEISFEALWVRYPRKASKTDARDRFLRMIRTPREFEELSQAVDAFLAHHRREKTTATYIPYFTTFLGVEDRPCWRDWLEPEAQTGLNVRPPAKLRSLADLIAEEALANANQ